MSKLQPINETTFQETINTGLTLVDVFAEWCGPCMNLMPVLEGMAPEFPDVKFTKMNADDSMVKMTELGIRTIPTVMLFKDGQEVHRFNGDTPKEKIVEMLSSL